MDSRIGVTVSRNFADAKALATEMMHIIQILSFTSLRERKPSGSKLKEKADYQLTTDS